MLNLKNGIRSIFYTLIVLVIMLLGCQKYYSDQKKESEQVVAKVNGYNVFVSDFKTAATSITRGEEFTASSKKEKILEDIITKKALILEALKHDFDKQETFMKEIESYWGQALLKFLLKNKTDEISKNIFVDDDEALIEYKARKRRYFAEIVFLDTRESAEKLSAAGDKFEDVKNTMKDEAISERPAQWWERENLPDCFMEIISSLKPGEISKSVLCDSKWAVVKVLRIEDTELEPFNEIKEQIKSDLRKNKIEEALDEWVEKVVKKTDIKINYDVLNLIDLQKLYVNQKGEGGNE